MTASKQRAELVLVDSSGWLEYLSGGEKAERFEPHLTDPLRLLVPSVVVYEVRKVLLRNGARNQADLFLSQAMRGVSVPFDERLALGAVENAIEKRLAMADAIIYTTARHYSAHLYTGDHHFAGLEGVTVY